MKKAPLKKRISRSFRPRTNVDPTRMALAALERIKTVLVNSGRVERLGEPLGMNDLAAQAELLGTELPPSYVAAMRVASRIGEPETFLRAGAMAEEAERLVALGGEEARRYAPFCKGAEHLVCFDKGGGKRLVSSIRYEGELPIVAWREGGPSPVAAHFGEWLDAIADAREDSVEAAAKMPPRLKRLLYELGFRFEYPIVGRLETADVDAIVELVGPELAREIRGGVDRLFDASGKASLTLNVDEFTLAASLRTGVFTFEAEDVFRWLRAFRDENFFSDAVTVASHPDAVRDLRRAPPEAPLVQRGVIRVSASPAKDLVFCAASGSGPDDFYLLGRATPARAGAPSVLLHVVDGAVSTALDVDERLADLHVTADGTTWGLTATHAVRLGGGPPQSFPLKPPGRGRPWWCGIGGAGNRVLVWGRGALLEFDRGEFVPFEPDAMLDESESVLAVHAQGLRLWMLVCGDRVGAVARFDSAGWQPISDTQVIYENLADLDVCGKICHVLDRNGGLWKIGESGPPEPVSLVTQAPAFSTEAGAPRRLHGVRSFEGGTLVASDGGVLAVGSGEPLFHAIDYGASGERGAARTPVRLVRVGSSRSGAVQGSADGAAIVAIGGPNAWIWRPGRGGRAASFDVIDMLEWT